MTARKTRIALLLLCVLMLMGCAGQQITPARTYEALQTAYLSAWNSYHAVWLALPETDARKTAWVKEYHGKFYTTGQLIQRYKVDGSIGTNTLIEQALVELEGILIKLVIRKGGAA